MKKKEMNENIQKELEHIPRGDLTQNILRSAYNSLRRHDLSLPKPEGPKSVLLKAVNELRKSNPCQEFQYDTEFFMPQGQPPNETAISPSPKNWFLNRLGEFCDYFKKNKKRNITICVLIGLAIVTYTPAKKYYHSIRHLQPKKVRINNLVIKSLRCGVIKISPFPPLDGVASIKITNVLLDLNSTAIKIDKTSDSKTDKAVADCLENNKHIRLGSLKQSQTPYHTLISKKGVIHFNFKTKSSTIEFSKRQDCLGINVVQGKITDARIAFDNDDQIRVTSNSDIVCNSATISQNQDWHIRLTKQKDIFLIGYEPKTEPHTVNFYFKTNSLKTPKNILAISDVFRTEMRNLLLTDAKGLISIGKDHIKLEEYDVLEIKDLKDFESKFTLDKFQLAENGIVIRGNGVAADICLNGTQLIKSKFENFFTKPIYFPVLAALIIIFSNLIAYIFKKVFG